MNLGPTTFSCMTLGKLPNFCVVLPRSFKGPSPWQSLLAFHTPVLSFLGSPLNCITQPPLQDEPLVVKISGLECSESKYATFALVLHLHSADHHLDLVARPSAHIQKQFSTGSGGTRGKEPGQ